MALIDKGLVFRLVPDIGAAIFLPRLWRHRLIGHHAKRRDDVFLEVLVLIVAPNHDKVGIELVEHSACIAKPGEQPLAMVSGGGHPRVVTVFLPHRRRPTLRTAERIRDRRIVERAFQNAPHILVRSRKRRKVGDAEPQDLCHIVLLPNDRAARIGFGRTQNKRGSPRLRARVSAIRRRLAQRPRKEESAEYGICRNRPRSLRGSPRPWQETARGYSIDEASR